MRKNSVNFFLFSLVLLFGIYTYFTYYGNNNNVITQEVLAGLKVSFLNVGQADSILIQDTNHNILIDAGNNIDGSKLVKYFKDNNISKFDYVIGTHAHEDHIGGMDDIINNFDINHFYMPDVVTTTKTFEDVIDALLNKNITFETPDVDSEFVLNDMKFKVLYVGTDSDNLNNDSIVLKLNYFDISFLFMGDATTSVEKEIINKDLSANIIKVGHHGSKTSSSEDFLDKVKPMVGIISVGKNNTYNLPSDNILDRYNRYNIKLYRTDQEGSIIVTSDGYKINIDSINTNVDGG